ncbi:BON domain-containing protein [Pseudomonas sp. BGr12]|uniref:BON domain-containing protein n=1 Tax=unclassified Pseudomonas TaxID=196821 RepID=UPI00177E95D4|nr:MULTISPECIES: BON domain-containing protein [unclassified Pseudomonas]MBD9502561.1 BON domain-containing protein [Pseudomonas sp. PDM17]MBD9577423.1 BON domain-containing protein [Pseudomonas sp. PDM23]MBD9671004.1 BON domain-containing protein [Pseudomonas sp. PDM21]MDL2428772.1 BON domain-containing protein [Pseudomonas sp. BJa5]
MPNPKILVLALGSALLALQPLASHAAEAGLTAQLAEARQEGSIWTAINLNRELKPYAIKVDVENGRAQLTGGVASEEQKALAGQIAGSVEGITAVDNQLGVDASLADAQKADATKDEGVVQKWDDATLAAKVKSKLLLEKRSAGLDIKVTSKSGAVTLEGTVVSEEASQKAAHLAAQTEGVSAVDNRLKVDPDAASTQTFEKSVGDAQAAVSDAWITSQIKAGILSAHALQGLSIGVSTRDGVVSLSGQVPNADERQQLIDSARKTRGVREVDATALKVAGQAA